MSLGRYDFGVELEVTFVASAAEFRRWLKANHARAAEHRIGFYKKASGRAGISYAEALDEALCFGWIDGVRKNIDAVSYSIRFSPRKPKSIWSQVNLRRVSELTILGSMQPSGLAAFAARDEKRVYSYSYEERERALDAAYEEKFRANAKAWEFYTAQPSSYRRPVNWWVMSAKKEETRWRRLAKVMEHSENGRRLT